MIKYTKELIIKADKANKGYLYFIDKDHPLATGNSGRVYLHRHVHSLDIGRWVLSHEQVHHIDENNINNEPDNLEILSVVEHAKLHNPTTEYTLVCPVCSENFIVTSSGVHRVHCSVKCANFSNIKVHITKEELEPLLWSTTAIVLGKLYGLSDKGIVKKAKSLGCKMPPPYFHNKTETFKQEQRILNNIM